MGFIVKGRLQTLANALLRGTSAIRMKTELRSLQHIFAIFYLLCALGASAQNPVGVFVTTSTSSVVEGQTFDVTIQANAPPAGAMQVNVGFILGGPGQPSAQDFNTVLTSLTLSPSQTSRTISIFVEPDGIFEGTETLEIRVNADSLVFPNYRPVAPTNAFVTIFDADARPTVAFTNAASNTSEAFSRDVVVRLSRASSSNVTVNWSNTGTGTALLGVDYNTSPSSPGGLLTFLPGETNKLITVVPINDTLYELDETVRLILASPTVATLGSITQHVVTIIDNDVPPTVGFGSATSSRIESGGTGTVPVNLSAASGLPVAVNWSRNPSSTATSGSDYNLTPSGSSGTLTFNPGETSKSFNVQILEDFANEGDERLILNLASPSNATLGGSTHTLTILDNDTDIFWRSTSVTNSEADGFATFRVELTSSLTIPITLQLTTVSRTATAGADFAAPPTTLSIAAGQFGVTISVPLLNDSLDEFLEIAELQLSNPSAGRIIGQTSAELRITDDEIPPTITFQPFSALNPTLVQFNENFGQVIRTVSLSRPSGRPVWCTVSVQGSSATIFDDFLFDELPNQLLTINEGETNASFSLTITDDALYEASENIVLTLAGLNGVTPGPQISGTIRILDNDPAPTAAFGNFSTSFQEAITSPSMPVQLSAPAGRPVKVNVAVVGGTATGVGVDFSLNSGSVFFSAGETQKNVSLTCVADSLDEPEETIELQLSPGTFNLDGFTPIGVAGIINRTFSIADDDPTPTATIVQSVFLVAEGRSTNATIRLTSGSARTVTLNVVRVSGNASEQDIAISPAFLTFLPGELEKTVTVTALEDALVEGDEGFSLSLANVLGATAGSARTFYIRDNDSVHPLPESAVIQGRNSGHYVRFRKAAGATTITSINVAETLLAVPLPDPKVAFEIFDNGVSTINYTDAALDPAPQGTAGSDRDFHSVPGTPGFAAGNIDHFAMSAYGYLYVPTAGNWNFIVRSDDGFRLRIGTNNVVAGEYVDGRAPADSLGVVDFPVAGFYRYELTYFEWGGGAQVEWLAQPPLLGGGYSLVGSGADGLLVFGDLEIAPTLRAEPAPVIPAASGHLVEFRKANFNLTNIAAAFSIVGTTTNDARVLAAAVDHGVSVINYDDASGVTGFFAGDRQVATPPLSIRKGSFAASGDDNFTLNSKGLIHIPTAGIWSFVVNSDDGFYLRMGADNTIVSQFPNPRGLGATTNHVNIPSPGYYSYDLIYFEWGGGALVEFFAFGPGQATPLLVGDAAGALRVYQGGVANVPLSITRSGNQKIIRWPASATGYILEVNSALAGPGAWAQAPGVPTIVGQFWQLTDSTAAGPRFYRLRK